MNKPQPAASSAAKTPQTPKTTAAHAPKSSETLRIEKFIPGGQALATLSSGKKIFLWNALPGETVSEFRVTKEKSSFAEGIALKIDNPSPFRTLPKDPCYLSTSPWQILDYDYELQQKSELLAEIFRQQKIIYPHSVAVETDGRAFHYRNKMEYALYYSHEDQKIHLAFHARGSHGKVPIGGSSLERPEILSRAQEIIDELNANGAEARRYQSLLLRANQKGTVEGGLYENHRPHPQFKNLSDVLLGQEYHYSPNGFFQINLPVYELTLQEIRKHIKTQKVLDLYSGVGTIGLSVAHDRSLTLVESDRSAYRELEHNCSAAPHAHPVYARSEDALDFLTSDASVILDPPRAGCDIKLIEKLLSIAPPCIIYLSCNPITQARDVKMLLEKYEIKKVQPYNFFPRTPHLENLIILEQKS